MFMAQQGVLRLGAPFTASNKRPRRELNAPPAPSHACQQTVTAFIRWAGVIARCTAKAKPAHLLHQFSGVALVSRVG